MLCEITVEPEYLKAELFDRRTAEETREALGAVIAAARKHGRSQILVSMHASRPIFQVERSGLLDRLKELGDMSRYRIALTGDSEELRLSQQYVESVARRAGINVRSFSSQQAALEWFKDRRWLPDRRRRQEPWEGENRRRQWRRSLVGIRPA
jgi:hypothetical protein